MNSPAQSPAERLVGSLRIVLILIAVMIALPAFATGAELAHALGAARAAVVAFAGAAFLAVIAALAGAAGARSRASTYQLIQAAFGREGGKWVNATIGATVIGWYGVVATLFADALASMAPDTVGRAPGWLLVCAGCAVTIVTSMFGFRALNILSAWTSPLKVLLLLAAFFSALRDGVGTVLAFEPASPATWGTGVSMVAGGLVVGAVLAPDICRFARTPRHAAVGCAIGYGICYPLVLLLAGFPSIAAGQLDLVKIMLALGLGVPAMLTVILAAWSTNSFNLYSATLIGATLSPRASTWLLALAAGIAGTGMALAGVSQMLVAYLVALSICIPPIAGVYLVQAWCAPVDAAAAPAWRPSAWLAWALGIGWAAVAAQNGWTLTQVPAIDALAVSAAAQWFAVRRGRARAVRPMEAK